MKKLLVKEGNQLTTDEINQINQAKSREFKVPPIPKEQKQKTIFFLLKDGEKILAIGELIPIEPIKFNGETFFVLGIGGIIANEKRKGFGREVINAIRVYLKDKSKTGVGSCALHNKIFYEKCGLGVNCSSLKRFIFREKGKKIINTTDNCVIYQGGSDSFMEKVLALPGKEVVLTRPFDW